MASPPAQDKPSQAQPQSAGSTTQQQPSLPPSQNQYQQQPAVNSLQDDDAIPQEGNVIEADASPEAQHIPAVASDDGYETDGASSASTSVTSSIRDYAFENSRRYHKFQEGRYQFPNDDLEQEREDMKHAMVVHLCNGKLHFAPLDNPQTILDIGTGTGIWAIDSKYTEETVLYQFRIPHIYRSHLRGCICTVCALP
jgi:hypothetical protein